MAKLSSKPSLSPDKNIYKHIPKDNNGFVSVETIKPPMFELCLIVEDDGKRYYGWWTGCTWDGQKVDPDTKIVKWRKLEKYE